jgi:hypothetical protein
MCGKVVENQPPNRLSRERLFEFYRFALIQGKFFGERDGHACAHFRRSAMQHRAVGRRARSFR